MVVCQRAFISFFESLQTKMHQRLVGFLDGQNQSLQDALLLLANLNVQRGIRLTRDCAAEFGLQRSNPRIRDAQNDGCVKPR
jgi:hypothetical protein